MIEGCKAAIVDPLQCIGTVSTSQNEYAATSPDVGGTYPYPDINPFGEAEFPSTDDQRQTIIENGYVVGYLEFDAKVSTYYRGFQFYYYDRDGIDVTSVVTGGDSIVDYFFYDPASYTFDPPDDQPFNNI